MSFTLRNKGAGIVLALVMAALATAALLSYVRSVENHATQGTQPVSAFVAKGVIPEGTAAEEALARGLIERRSIPRSTIVTGAIASLEEITGRTASVTILPGEQILASRFVTASQAAGTLPIPAGRQAMSVEVGVPSGTAGFIQPGDHVSVLAKITIDGNPPITKVQFLMQDVVVLATGVHVVPVSPNDKTTTAPNQSGGQLLTLAVTPKQAEKLGFATLEGQIYFTLLPKGQKAASTPGRTSANVFAS